MNRRVRSVVWGLIAVMMVVTGLFFVRKEESRTWPSISSGGPSGLGALAELLRKEGYTVTSVLNERPDRANGDLIILPSVEEEELDFFGPSADKEEDEKGKGKDDGLLASKFPRLESSINRHLNAGKQVLVLGFPEDFDEYSTTSSVKEVSSYQDEFEGMTLTLPNDFAKEPKLPFDLEGLRMPILLDSGNERSVAELFSKGKKTVVMVPSAGFASNRMLAQASNAEVMLYIIRGMAPKGSKIVFSESYFGNSVDENILTMLGRWSFFMLWQGVLLLVIVAYSSSRRFGEPVRNYIEQRGSRNLIDAVSVVLRGSRKGSFALELCITDVETRVRKVMRLPRSAAPNIFMSQAPKELYEGWMTSVEISRNPKLNNKDALQQTKLLQNLVDAYEKDSRRGRGSAS